jgi:hypothetical protein
MTNIIALPPRPTRISAKLRCALVLMARQGLSQTEAAKQAGMSRQGLAKALGRAVVRDLLEVEKARFIAEADGMRVWAKARAIEVAMELMTTAKSEAVRARMCEFLASDARAPSVAISQKPSNENGCSPSEAVSCRGSIPRARPSGRCKGGSPSARSPFAVSMSSAAAMTCKKRSTSARCWTRYSLRSISARFGGRVWPVALG